MERKASFCLLMVVFAVMCIAVNSYKFNGWVVQPTAPSAMRLFSAVKSLRVVKNRAVDRYDLTSMRDDSVSSVDMAALFEQADFNQVSPPSVGDMVTGTVIELDDNGALLEMGGKMSGYIPLKEVSLMEIASISSVLEVGQEITGEVVGRLKGMSVVSLKSMQLEVAWDQLNAAKEADSPIDVVVLEVKPSGAVCSFLGLQAFLPGSHLVGIADASLLGKTIKVKVLDSDEEDGRLIVSQRKLLAAESSHPLQRGSVLSATVSGLRTYGVFLELENGATGLLHVSQVSSDRVEELEKLFSIGQQIKVMVLDFDAFSGKVALSTRALESTPGEMLRDMSNVFANAEATAVLYHARMEAERAAREAAAKEIVSGLGAALNGDGLMTPGSADDVANVATSIESILASIVESSQEKK